MFNSKASRLKKLMKPYPSYIHLWISTGLRQKEKLPDNFSTLVALSEKHPQAWVGHSTRKRFMSLKDFIKCVDFLTEPEPSWFSWDVPDAYFETINDFEKLKTCYLVFTFDELVQRSVAPKHGKAYFAREAIKQSMLKSFETEIFNSLEVQPANKRFFVEPLVDKSEIRYEGKTGVFVVSKKLEQAPFNPSLEDSLLANLLLKKDLTDFKAKSIYVLNSEDFPSKLLSKFDTAFVETDDPKSTASLLTMLANSFHEELWSEVETLFYSEALERRVADETLKKTLRAYHQLS